MKKILGIVILTAFLPFPVQAEDEFGDRFYNQAPAALESDPLKANEELLADDEAARALQAIAPAAGDEEPVKLEQETSSTAEPENSAQP